MDRHQLSGTSVSTEYAENIRRATHADISWLIELAHSRYKGQWAFDVNQALLFLLQTLQSPQWLILRGNRSAGVVFWDSFIFNPHVRRAHVYLLASYPGKDLEPYHIVQHMVLWARKQGCLSIDGADLSEHAVSVFLKRIGAKEDKPTYTLELERIH